MSDNTPTREQVEEALDYYKGWTDDDDRHWPVLIAAARLWLKWTEPTPDDDVGEAPRWARYVRKPL